MKNPGHGRRLLPSVVPASLRRCERRGGPLFHMVPPIRWNPTGEERTRALRIGTAGWHRLPGSGPGYGSPVAQLRHRPCARKRIGSLRCHLKGEG